MLTFLEIEESQKDETFQKMCVQLDVMIDEKILGKTMWIPQILLYQMNKDLFKKCQKEGFFLTIDQEFETLDGFYDFLKDFIEHRVQNSLHYNTDFHKLYASFHFKPDFYKLDSHVPTISEMKNIEKKAPEYIAMNLWKLVAENCVLTNVKEYFDIPEQFRPKTRPIQNLYHQMTIKEFQKIPLKEFAKIQCCYERYPPTIVLDNKMRLVFGEDNVTIKHHGKYIECNHQENKGIYKLCSDCLVEVKKNSMYYSMGKKEKSIKIVDPMEYKIIGDEKLTMLKENLFKIE